MTSRETVYDRLGNPAETIGEGTQKILISPDRVVGETIDGYPGQLDLRGLEFEIGYGQNEDQDAPYFAILLEVHPRPAGDELADLQDAHRRHRTIVFRESPPVDWIHGLIDGQYLVRAALEDRDGSHLADVIGLIANLALTPAARVLVRATHHPEHFDVILLIDGDDSRGQRTTWRGEVLAYLPLTRAGT